MFLLNLSPAKYEQVFCLFALFFQTSYFVSLKMLMWHRILHMQETNMTQVHQLNIQTILLLCFCFLCRMNRSLCNPMFWFLEWYFCGIYKKSGWWNFTSIRWTKNKANSFHCLDITFIQDINFQYLAGPLCWIHSSILYAPPPREANTHLMLECFAYPVWINTDYRQV